MLLFFFFPFLERFKLDPDEGFNAIKGLLLVRGYPLYSEIWSDQPPFFTYLIAATIQMSKIRRSSSLRIARGESSVSFSRESSVDTTL